ncbi:unnamed protein product, partial [marine sediment metagenome]
MDLTLDWLLPAFGMGMSDRAIRARSAPLENSGAAPAVVLEESASYRGIWFPIQVPPSMSVLSIRATTEEQASGVVTAATRVGLGKVAVVSLRGWFPGADNDRERDPWEYGLIAGILDWFGAAELPRRHPAAAQHWAAARRLAATGAYGAAVQELDRVGASLPAADDARYWAACLLADRIGDTDGAVRRWREVSASKAADPWLVRMANLRLGILALRARDGQNASRYLRAAASEQPDRIWGAAWVAAGDLRLAQGDYLGAAQHFRL